MSKLILVRGAMGAGKSTHANKLKAKYIKFGYKPTDIQICEADQFFEDEDGNYNFDASKLWLAHKTCLNKTIKGLRSGKIVIVANTFATPKEMEPYLQFAHDNDIDFEVHRCTGEYQNVHNVPEEAVIRKRKQMVDFEGEEFV